MDNTLKISVQRKVLGAYLNAEEFSCNGSNDDILKVKLDESLFDLSIHKAIVRACNRLLDEDTPISDYVVLDFLQKHNMPRNIDEETEYLTVISEIGISPKTFNKYLSMLLDYKLGV